jgi:hypothetical protein
MIPILPTMQNNFFRVAQKFFNPETLVPFFIGALFLSVLGTAVSDILKALIGDDTEGAVKIAIGSIAIFLICVWLVQKSLTQNSPSLDIGKSSPLKHKGLILLVSREEPCIKAIEYHLSKLEYCWLICSSQSFSIAEKLQQHYSQAKIQQIFVINDVYDPIEFARVVAGIYERLPQGLTKKDIIADFTGMTALGSVGTAIASLLIGRSKLQYTPAESQEGRLTGRSLNPIEIVLKERRLYESKT